MHLRLICYYEHYMPSWLKWVLPGDLMCCLLVEVGEGHFVYCDVVLLVDFRHLGMIDLDFPKDLLFVCVDLQLVCFFLMIDLEYYWLMYFCFQTPLWDPQVVVDRARLDSDEKYSPSKASFHKHGNQTLNEEELISCIGSCRRWRPENGYARAKTWRKLKSSWKAWKSVDASKPIVGPWSMFQWSTWRQDKSRCRQKGIRAKVHHLPLWSSRHARLYVHISNP